MRLFNEKGIGHIGTVLMVIVIASFLAFTFFVGTSDANDKALMPSIKSTATEATESLSKLVKQKGGE